MRRCLVVAFMVVWSAGALAQTRPSPAPVLAITHVTVIDATGAPAQSDHTVVIEDGRIARDIDVDARRPRQRGSADLAALEGSILSELLRGGDERSA